MGIEEGSRLFVTLPHNDAGSAKTENGRIQKLARQEPSIIPISTTITATTWITRVVEETRHPLDDSGNRQLRYPVSLEAPSPAALPTHAPITSNSMDSPAQPTGQVPRNSTTQAANMPSNSASGIEPWTQKVLIAAGSIGATLVVAFLIVVLYRWKKKKPLFCIGKRKSTKLSQEPQIRGPFNPIPPWQKEWQESSPYAPAVDKNRWEFNSSAGSLINKPQPAFSRPNTSLLNRSSPLGLHQAPSQSRFPPPNPLPSPSPLAERSVLYIDPRASRIQYTSVRRASIASSSPVLPIEGPGISDSPNLEKRRSSTPSIIDSLPGDEMKDLHSSPRKGSRFSWTNSQAPKTPMDQSRFSIATSTSSVPRHRTVDSWVGYQASRLDESIFQGYLEEEINQRINRMSLKPNASAVTVTTTLINDKDDTSHQDSRVHMTSVVHNAAQKSTNTYTAPPLSSRKYATGSTRRSRKLRASDFMQHPGTKINTPRVSLIPSEVLDAKVGRPRESMI